MTDLSSPFKGLVLTPRKTKTPSMLNRLPPEIRIEIFKRFLVQRKTKYRTPSLIKALRPEQKLYHEALRIFYSKNTFILDENNKWGFGTLAKEHVETMEKLWIMLVDVDWPDGRWRHQRPQPIAEVRRATRLRKVTIGHFELRWGFPKGLALNSFVLSFPFWLVDFRTTFLRRVTVIIPTNTYMDSSYSFCEGRLEDVQKNVELANDVFSVPGKLAQVVVWKEKSDTQFESWFWQAEEGKVLSTGKPLGLGKIFGSNKPRELEKECMTGGLLYD